MSMQVGDLFAVLRLDDGQYRQAMRAAGGVAAQAGNQIEQSMNQAENSVEDTGEAAQRTGRQFESFGGIAKKALGGLAAAFGAQQLIGFFSDSIEAASDLGESTNKVATIFKDGAKDVLAFGENAAITAGLSNGAARDAAAMFGIMGKSAGLAGKDLATFSTDFVTLAADLASFNNTSPEEAVEAIGAALRGEAEPMRAYGVLIDEASLKQEALRLGLIKTTSEGLDPQAKILATQAILYRDTAVAQGDFAKTSDGLANQTRIMAAEFENVKARVGEGLLPVWQKLVTLFADYGVPAIEALGTSFSQLAQYLSPVIDVLVDLVKWVVDLPGPLIVAVAALAGWALFSSVAGYVTAFAGSVIAASVAVKTFLVSLGPIGILAAVAATAFTAISFAMDDSNEGVQEAADRWDRLKGTLDATTGAVTDATRAQLAAEAQNTGMLDTLDRLGVSTKAYIDASAGVEGGQKDLLKSVSDASKGLVDQSTAYQNIEDALKGAGITQAEFIAAVQSGDISAIQSKLNDYAETLARTSGNTADATNLQNDFQGAVAALSPDLSILGGALNLAKSDSGAFGQAAADAAQRAAALGTDAEAAAAGVDAAAEAAAAAEEEVSPFAEALEASREAASNVAEAIDFLKVKLDELKGTSADMAEIQRELDSSIRDVGTAARDTADALATQEEKAIAVHEAVAEFGGGSAEAAAAQREYENATDAVADAIDGEAESLKAVREKAIEAAGAAYDNAIATGTQEDATKAASDAMQIARDKFINSRSEADKLSGAAAALADELGLIPGDVETVYSTPGADAAETAAVDIGGAIRDVPTVWTTLFEAEDRASSVARGVQSAFDQVDRVVTTLFQSSGAPPGGATGGRVGRVMGLPGFARGGRLPGRPPSDPGIDNLLGVTPQGLIGVRSREWLVQEKAADYYGDRFMQDLNQRRIPKMGYASGGRVSGGAVQEPSGDLWVQISLGGQGVQEVVDASVSRGLSTARHNFTKAGGQR